MDGECNRILKLNYDLTYSGFLPVFYKEKNNVELTINEINSNDIKVVWLGRIDMDFKIHILKKVLLDIDLIKEDLGNQVVFNIIGNGPGLEELKKFVRLKINYQVNFLNELKGNCLSNALKENHIGFAMGTSALDIAAVKVPTVLLDFSYNEIVDYNYRWLFESNDHILGRDIKLLSTNEIKSMKSLLLIFQELRENPLKIKEQCFEYLNENHSSADMARRILNFLSNTELTLHDIYQYRTTKPIWNKISHLLRKFRK